jgi:hypothetical protein
MRQVCNTTSETFYSIHRNQKFGVVTVYNSDAKDMVGRKAYVAISLYIPANYQFIGDVGAVLNHLKNYYIQKQADSYVNMFTAQMFTEQYSTLDCEINNGFVIPGISKGYLKFNHLNDIKDRFRLLDINGYQSAFFIPSSVTGPENQLQDYQIINEFKDTIGVLVEGYDSSRHKIMYNNEPVSKLETNFLLEVKPGIETIFIDLINNRRQSFLRFTPNQVINLVALFPVQNNKPYNFESKDPLSFTSTQSTIKKKENKVGKILLVCGVFISIIALVVVAILKDDLESWWDGPKPPIVNSPTGGSGNEGDEENNGGGGSTADSIVVYAVSALYDKRKDKLSPDDTTFIKKSQKEKENEIKGIINISFLPDLKKVQLKYNASILKDPLTALKKIVLPIGQKSTTPLSPKTPIKPVPSPKIADFEQ